MSQDFIKKVIDGFGDEGAYKLDIHDQVVIFLRDGLSVQGKLLGMCSEGLLVDCGCSEMWINSEAIVAAAKIPGALGGGDGGGREEFAPPGGGGEKQKPEPEGSEIMNRVFCNGTH